MSIFIAHSSRYKAILKAEKFERVKLACSFWQSNNNKNTVYKKSSLYTR
jgi:hypothetical protein